MKEQPTTAFGTEQQSSSLPMPQAGYWLYTSGSDKNNNASTFKKLNWQWNQAHKGQIRTYIMSVMRPNVCYNKTNQIKSTTVFIIGLK